MIPCDMCGKDVYQSKSRAKSYRHRFCSHECHNRWMSEHQRGPDNPQYEEIPKRRCEHCGELIQRRVKAQKYCDLKCARTAKRTRVTVSCSECGCKFERMRSQLGGRELFCSRKCWRKYRRMHRQVEPSETVLRVRAIRDKTVRKWRKAVLPRDEYRCRGCGVGNDDTKIYAHHILPVGSFPHLADDVQNGITLCRECHKQTMKHEMEWAPIFQEILN